MNWDDNVSNAYEDFGQFTYQIQFPWTFRFGGAVNVGSAMISGDIELIDYSQIKYKSDPSSGDLTQSGANLEIKQNLKNIMNYRLGGEIGIPGTGLALRGGYAVYPSPFKDAPSGWDRKVISLGAGFAASEQVEFNLGAASTSWDGIVEGDISKEKIEMKKVLVSLLYRM
jgi:long-subunit fatty acid transport protein